MCNSKKHSFWRKIFERLENSLNDPKGFWNKWRKCTEQVVTDAGTKITGKAWFSHFSKLHNADTGVNITPSL